MTPCIGICTLQNNICIGCNRTIEEIKEAYEKLKGVECNGSNFNKRNNQK
tara:strand:+ start:199 stop:348 length:150 start_codon:yes stop_codon:yes gene_type:complete